MNTPTPNHVIEPTTQAQARLVAYHNETVDAARADLQDVASYAARWAEQAWRISVVLHAGLHGAEAHRQPLDEETAANAIRIARWFASQQLGILSRGRRAAARKVEDEVLELLAEFQDRKGRDYLTPRDVQRARIVTTAEAAHALLARLETDGLLTGEDVQPHSGGRVLRIYRKRQGERV